MIREETAADAAAAHGLLEAAFESAVEAQIVDALRESCDDRLALVAERDGAVVGHILFTPVEIATGAGLRRGYGLAPMAVAPAWQRRGIGSALIAEGVGRLRAAGAPFILVIGHPEYYPRFGFERASRYGVRCKWPEVADDAVMLLLLDSAMAAHLAGVAHYRPEWDASV